MKEKLTLLSLIVLWYDSRKGRILQYIISVIDYLSVCVSADKTA